MGRIVEASAHDRAVKPAAQALGAETSHPAAADRATAAIARLVAAGQTDGDVHLDVTVDDF